MQDESHQYSGAGAGSGQGITWKFYHGHLIDASGSVFVRHIIPSQYQYVKLCIRMPVPVCAGMNIRLAGTAVEENDVMMANDL